jgi:hypothetical protein
VGMGGFRVIGGDRRSEDLGVARYYFDIYDGVNVTRDEVGVELDTVQAAKDEAMRALSEIARSELPSGDRLNLFVTVRDASRQKVFYGHLNMGARFE